MNYHPTPQRVIPVDGVPPIDRQIDSYLQSDGYYYRVCRDESNKPYFEMWKNGQWKSLLVFCGDEYLDYLRCLETDSILKLIKRVKFLIVLSIIVLSMGVAVTLTTLIIFWLS